MLYAASTTIDDIDNLFSQNEVYLENFEVEDDQRLPEINVVCYQVSSQDAMSFKTLGVLDLDPISKIEAYIFFMGNPTYKEMFFGCPDHERKCVLLTLMSRPKN
ncbi:hypothetical protein SO802_017011 [Lithocarpus litseifolius]|uniref:Uncharacterized protein n=1 Tax=Lithocarpus litseifolius TaxID=425828 RepID=A0AAW2D1I2_9ROSI